MSTKAHFIYENGIEGYEEALEPQRIFGTFTGFNAYLIIDEWMLKKFKFTGEYLKLAC